ncbi:MAG: cell division protein FtsL [Deltaproteobacteria bacterium]|nr:cell division protein FtsL [Deltaproteobacteria bacterium]
MFRAGQEPTKATGVLDRQDVAEARVASRRGDALWPIVLSCLLVALALLLVWQRLRVVQLGYVLSTAAKLERRLEQTNRELKLELGSLTAPDRVETMARKRLGLKDPEGKRVVVVP